MEECSFSDPGEFLPRWWLLEWDAVVSGGLVTSQSEPLSEQHHCCQDQDSLTCDTFDSTGIATPIVFFVSAAYENS